MTKTKITGFAFGASMLALAALSSGAFAADKSKGPLKVAVFSVNAASPTIHAMIESAIAAAKERGWTVEMYDGNGDQVATNNQVNTYITRGFDALINVASDNNQMGGVIANANKAKIPFVSTFSGMVPGITVDIGSNNVADGVFAASALGRAHRRRGRSPEDELDRAAGAGGARRRLPCGDGRVQENQGHRDGNQGARVRSTTHSTRSRTI